MKSAIPSSAFPPGLRIGLLGGSFNPAHEGHLAISLAALKALQLDRVVWLVSPHNPLKAAAGLADYEARLQSARAMARHPRIAVSDFEREERLTYTVETLAALKHRHPRCRFVLLIGADNLLQIPRWKGWTRLFEMVPIAVFARPGWTHAALSAQAAQRFRRALWPALAAPRLAFARPPAWIFLPHTHRAESATAIRARGDWPGIEIAP